MSIIWSVLGLLAVPLLVVINGLFVAAEFGLVAVRRTRLQELVEARKRGARAAQQAHDNLDLAIAATQMGVTLASLGLGWVGEPVLAHFVEPIFPFLPQAWSGHAAHSVLAFVLFIFITFLHVVVGELVPKAAALQIPDTVATLLAGPLLIFGRIVRPLLSIMRGTGNLILRLCGMNPIGDKQMVHSVVELGMLIEETQKAGVLSADQAKFVQNVFQLTKKKIAEVMVSLDRMASLELHMSPERVLEAVRQGAHTRMPVYDKDPDHIVGIVNTKDLFHLFSMHGLVVLEDAMYPTPFVRPDDLVSTVLRRLKRLKRHMAIVRDDDGRVVGLITLEDVLEEIVGEIEDEHDRLPERTG